MSAATVFSPVLAGLNPLPPRIAPRAGSIARPVRVTAAVLQQSDGVATADIDEVLHYSSRASLPAQLRPDATHLLPAYYARGPQRIADVGRYWAMPNLRPLKETDDGKINMMKFASVLILGAVLGALVKSNMEAARDAAPTAGADVDVDTGNGYGYAYGYGYGYRYGYGYGHGYGDEYEITTKRSAPEVEWTDDSRPARKKLSESDNIVVKWLAKLGIGLMGVWNMIPA